MSVHFWVLHWDSIFLEPNVLDPKIYELTLTDPTLNMQVGFYDIFFDYNNNKALTCFDTIGIELNQLTKLSNGRTYKATNVAAEENKSKEMA